MPRFYISDGNRPGLRIPTAEWRTKSDRTSDILNEAQAITRQRKLLRTKPQFAIYQFWKVRFDDNGLGGGSVALNELQMWDYDGVNRVLGNPPDVTSGSQQAGCSNAALVNGVTTSSTSINTYSGFAAPCAGKFFLWDFGVPRRITSVVMFAPAFNSYTYAPAAFTILAGDTSDCLDGEWSGAYVPGTSYTLAIQ
jgi:hypothetical protein